MEKGIGSIGVCTQLDGACIAEEVFSVKLPLIGAEPDGLVRIAPSALDVEGI